MFRTIGNRNFLYFEIYKGVSTCFLSLFHCYICQFLSGYVFLGIYFYVKI